MKIILTFASLMFTLTACNSNREAAPQQIQSPLINCKPAMEPNYVAAMPTEHKQLALPTEPSNGFVAMLQSEATRNQNVKPSADVVQ